MPSILVVDDDSSVLLTYRVILEQNGFAVSTASSVDDALAALQQKKFDLLMCDLGLGEERDGLQVVAAARDRYPEIHVLLMTGFASDELAREVEQKGVLLLQKPVEVPGLLATLKKLAA